MCLHGKNWVDSKLEPIRDHVKSGSKLDRLKYLGRSNYDHVNTWVDPRSISERPKISMYKTPYISFSYTLLFYSSPYLLVHLEGFFFVMHAD